MDPLNSEAITNLRTTISALLPAPGAPELASDIYITQASINPVGISGVIGMSSDPEGEIFARQVKASIAITIKSSTLNDLPASFENSVNNLLSFGQAELRQLGVLKLEMDKPGEIKTDTLITRDINLNVFYEYQKHPETAGDIIDNIPNNITIVID